jgi:hypothetical protein
MMEIISYMGIFFLTVLFGLSIWGNVFFLRKLMRVNENIYFVLGSLEDYSSHLKDVYSMERFYGDETLQDLLEHSKATAAELENFIEQYEQAQDETPSQK